MTNITREHRLGDAFVTLADTMVAGFDVVDLLQTLVETCRDILDVDAAGILLRDDQGDLDVIASTSESSHLVEVMQVDAQEGPCMECARTGQAVSVVDLDVDAGRWPRFQAEAKRLGFRSVFAVPLRLRAEVIGTLNILRAEPGDMPPADLRSAQALADVATIGILQERSVREADVVREQLQRALTTRIVIEQAKGFVAHTNQVTPDEAFHLLRAQARRNGEKLSDVAQSVLDRRRSV